MVEMKNEKRKVGCLWDEMRLLNDDSVAFDCIYISKVSLLSPVQSYYLFIPLVQTAAVATATLHFHNSTLLN